MSHGAAPARPPNDAPTRRTLAAVGLAIAVAVCLPDLFGVASGSELAQTLWYAAMAMVAPALIVLGASRSLVAARDAFVARLGGRRAGGVTEHHSRFGSRFPAAVVLVADLVAIACWRTPAFVNALANHPVLVLAEATTLVLAGVLLWLELVDLPARVSRSPRPRRAVLAALAMWTVWTLAYLGGMSSTGWYDAFHHVAGVGLSAAADRQVSAAALWAVAAVVFMPVVFWNLAQWLRAESGTKDQPLGAGRDRRAFDPLDAT